MAENKTIRRAIGDSKKLILEIEAKELEAKKLTNEANAYRKQIKAEMLDNKIDSYIVEDDNPKFLQASVYTSSRVSYDLEMIKAKLPKEKRKLVSNTLMVAEQEGLKQFIKNHPELRDELKTFINKVEVIDEHKLGLALQHGNISLKDIDGCYEVKDTNVFKLQRVKKFELL
jgi:hypothetical protein